MSDFMNEKNDSMIGKLFNRTPVFVQSLLGTAVALILVLKFGGLDVPLNTVMNAWAKKYEQSALVMDGAASRINTALDRLDSVEKAATDTNERVTNLEVRVTRIERAHQPK